MCWGITLTAGALTFEVKFEVALLGEIPNGDQTGGSVISDEVWRLRADVAAMQVFEVGNHRARSSSAMLY